MSKELTVPEIGQVWYNKKGNYRFVIISKQQHPYRFYCLRENMKPFVPFWETFLNSDCLGSSIANFKDMFRVLQGEPLNDKDTN